MKAFAQLIWEVRRTRNSQAVSDFVWACWELHAYLAGIGKGLLLDTLYLSIMDVGVSYLRAVLEATAPAVHLNPLAPHRPGHDPPRAHRPLTRITVMCGGGRRHLQRKSIFIAIIVVICNACDVAHSPALLMRDPVVTEKLERNHE
ncbi:hypothetical protein ACFVKB_04180 [Rhodococcus sp. NPDC127530]|uniref:hypothetical protein n=1 Tax=unclassified Rhodococcus (in: high G+C Gram-positive bacteria) TaxID=192944 RepID=UPI00362CF4AC